MILTFSIALPNSILIQLGLSLDYSLRRQDT